MATPQHPSVPTAATAGHTAPEELLSERDRAAQDSAEAAAPNASSRRDLVQEDARRRLAERYGNDLEKIWIADPNGPLVEATSLIHAFLQKARSAGPSSPEMWPAPELERADALAAAHMIGVARRDAQNREFNAMRQILAHGVSWDELADALETSAEELWESARRHGARPETWTAPMGEPE